MSLFIVRTVNKETAHKRAVDQKSLKIEIWVIQKQIMTPGREFHFPSFMVIAENLF